MMTRFRFLALLLAIPVLAHASPSLIKITAEGQRMIITGRVFNADGTPRSGLEMFAYHTDARGLYNRDSHGIVQLHGTLVTARDGSYEIDTIKPAPYPGRNIPAHVHVHLRGPGFDQEEEIRFEGAGSYICRLRAENGVLRCTVDFRLKASSH